MAEQVPHTNDFAQVWDLIKDIRIAMLTTKDSDGCLKARPMATQNHAGDGFLWFITRLDSAKSEEIERDHEVLVSYADEGASNYVAVSGTASILQDAEKLDQFWNPMADAWFEGGKSDPEAGLVRVKIESAEYWAGKHGKVGRFFAQAKAAVGGTYDPGTHGVVEVL